jgi:hypothetical protein
MGKFKLGLGLKKQGSKTLSGADPNPNPGNPYPMASGGHHAGRLGSRDQTYPPAQPSRQANLSHPAQPSGSADYPDEQAAVAASELAAQESGRLSERRSAGQQQEEQAMLELAIKVGTSCKPMPSSIVSCIVCCSCCCHLAGKHASFSWEVSPIKTSMMLGSIPVPAVQGCTCSSFIYVHMHVYMCCIC